MKNLIWKPTLPPAREYKKKSLKELAKIADFIYQIGESPILREPSKPVMVKRITAWTTQQKFAYLKKCLIKFRRITKGKGRGIAAVQVGIPEQFFLLYRTEKRKKYQLFINPEITRYSDEYYRYSESCMSCNNLVAPVVRPVWVEVAYYDEEGVRQEWREKDTTKAGKMYNRVIQHEIDHLNGIINTDRVQSSELFFDSGDAIYEKATFQKVQTRQPDKKAQK